MQITGRWIAVAAMPVLASGAAVAQTQSACANYSQVVSGAVSAPGDSNGAEGILPGQTVTFTLQPGTATSAVWNIVGSSSGAPVWAGPGGLGSTLSFTVPAGAPRPVGYYIVSIDGTATIVASCVQGELPTIPALDPRMLGVLAAALAATAWMLRRRFTGR